MYLSFKRVADIGISFATLLLFMPLFIPLIVALKVTAEGEVWYKQKRLGYKNQFFHILKFATMLKNSPNLGTGSLTVRNDPRVTAVGKFLRKSKLNELPQIFNVIKGDLSLVGPRPQMDVDFNAYPKKVQKIIYNVKPGITGIGSIIFRDEEALLSKPGIDVKSYYKEIIAPYKGELEIWYQNNISFVTDFKILVLTVLVIFFPGSQSVYKWFPGLPRSKTLQAEMDNLNRSN